MSEPTQAELDEMRDWVAARPEPVREVMRRFPPGCYVVAKEGRTLMCPAPGERGMVDRYLETNDGRVLLGVTPMETDASGPMGVMSFLLGGGYAQCDPDWLDVVDSDKQFALLRGAEGGAPQ